MRTPAVQHRKLTKKIFFHLYINGSTQERKRNFVKILLLLGTKKQKSKKVFNIEIILLITNGCMSDL